MVRRLPAAALALLLIVSSAAAALAATNQHITYVPLAINTAPKTVAGLPFDPYGSPSGDGTYYTTADGSGNCSFDPSPQDMDVGAMNRHDYLFEQQGYPALLCGAYVDITGPKGSVRVRIVDQCPECQPGDIDLSPQAFAKIADMVQGRVRISWHVVSPALTGPIAYKIKEGTNPWWLGVQVRNHRNPIWKMEYRAASGAFVPMQRYDYNYFIADNAGPGPLTLRVTDIYGNVLTDSGIPVLAGSVTSGRAQFPARP